MKMNRLLRVTCVCTLVLFGIATVGNASTISLKRGAVDPTYYPGGYNGAADNTIFYYWNSTVGSSTYPEIWMRTSDGGYSMTKAFNGPTSQRALYRFDLGGMSGQNVTVVGNATLTLTGYTETAAGFYALYQIAAANAGWQESTNILTPTAFNATTATNKANNGDPTWFYKSIDTINNTPTTPASADTTSTKWASGQTSVGNSGSNPEGYANTGGLWNWIDLVDQDPSTVVNNYVDMANGLLEPVAYAPFVNGGTMTFTIPQAMVQSWIDNPAANAGLLGRNTASSSMRIRSSESSASVRPTLTFDYVIPEPATLSLLSFGLLGFLRRR
jgi:hypothetical protein